MWLRSPEARGLNDHELYPDTAKTVKSVVDRHA